MENTGSSKNEEAAGTVNGNGPAQSIVPNGVEIALQDKAALGTVTVVKRNGMLVPFRRDRIAMAIESAARATKNIAVTDPLPADLHTQIQTVTAEVVKEANHLALEGACLTVEGIQDIVEV